MDLVLTLYFSLIVATYQVFKFGIEVFFYGEAGIWNSLIQICVEITDHLHTGKNVKLSNVSIHKIGKLKVSFHFFDNYNNPKSNLNN